MALALDFVDVNSADQKSGGSGGGLPQTTINEWIHPERTTEANRVKRLRMRFLYAWRHPLWVRYRREATEDMDFLSGRDQWPTQVRNRLQKEGRTVLQINQIRPVVSILVGYERSSRLEIRPMPTQETNEDDVEVLRQLLKKVSNDIELEYIESDCFKEGIIGGLSVAHIGTDYTEDPIHGKTVVTKTRPMEVIWDPDWTRYDLNDARDIFWHKMVPVDMLVAQYPEQEDVITRAMEDLRTTTTPDKLGELPERDPHDGYRNVDPSGVVFYDAVRDEVRVMECWYRVWNKAVILIDEDAETAEQVAPDDKGEMALARARVAQSQGKKHLIERSVRSWQMSTIVPAINLELDKGHPHPNDEENHPFAPFIAYKEGEEIQGVVRNLKDPQREVNKRRSSMADNVSRFGNIRWIARLNSVKNPQFFDEGAGAGNVLWTVGPVAQDKPEMITPPQMPAWVVQMEGTAKNEIREISGVNADLLGQRDPDSSGIAIARRQQQGQIVSTELFDNYRRFRRILAIKLAKRVQQTFTDDQVIRIDTAAGETKWVRLNQEVVDPHTGQVTVIRDIPNLKYDVEMADSPSTPTARATALSMMLDMVQKMPQLGPALAPVIIEMSDIPNRAEVLNVVRGMAQSGALNPVQPGQGAPGGPPAPGTIVRGPQTGPRGNVGGAPPTPPPVAGSGHLTSGERHRAAPGILGRASLAAANA